MVTAAEIRQRFLEYFARQGHEIVKSSPLVPKDDPSLLFTNAGMVQFKKVFLGQDKRNYVRATTSQKCLRVGGKHNDLENVGRTARHHTFFEMLGNFSFGDYFKREAVDFAWRFLTEELGLPKDRLYASVYREDDEAYELWKEIAGLPDERIYRLGEKDNFWSMGDTGPCGPCSEILIDQGSHMSCGPECEIGVCECDRFLEIWNLVFMQFDRDASGTMTPLPQPSIDTGMGLERIAAVCQGVYSNFDTDLFSGLIRTTAERAGVVYGKDEEINTALRVIGDHSRAVAFMLADGILPSNEGRGYVLRRLIRRAFRFGRLIGLRDPFLFDVCSQVVSEMGDDYPELHETAAFMVKVVRQEEERFGTTLDKGLALLEEELESLQGAGQTQVPGGVAFKLYDTFGFPIDIVNDVAEARGFTVDEAGFQEHMQAQKERSKAAWSGSGATDMAARFVALLEAGVQSDFVGYETLQSTSRIAALLKDDGQEVQELAAGENGYLVTARTPFYGESGGQVGDSGRVIGPRGDGAVLDTIKPAAQLTVHSITVKQGSLAVDDEAELIVDEGERVATARNHTVTHLLHAALREVLGEHVKQAGSLVASDRLRFDLTHIQALTAEEIQAVEDKVNQSILADTPVESAHMDYSQAVQGGAVALFGEKYEDEVRVIDIPGVSRELCGGTHLRATGQAGFFCILSEAAVSAGVRRIEAATGWQAVRTFTEQRTRLREAAQLLKAPQTEITGRIQDLQEQLKSLRKEKEALEGQLQSAKGGDLMSQVEELGGIPVLTAEVEAPDVKTLRGMMDDVRSKLSSGVVLLAAKQEAKAMLILFVSQDLHDRFTAPGLIKQVAQEIGGSGGGRPDVAQAGGGNPEGIPAALDSLRNLVGGQ
ncbi:alanine--tRNA ligase [Desulfohalobium retbaense]|uniref:Alanine--tRNA ligase n=1 Tax=Desulfohalobium retbaense (strain ATCC 49708 / DSM 5692 / JCM 16813 / HR100) TaxID=485915 RepID=C8WZY8_DESRD|nr:alanine--tRNA ligase [Desulfohalobium retbaense]ACV67613.1 alanyl-tRNA synthetase [Desulfohalobium retbaense DSM 5692]